MVPALRKQFNAKFTNEKYQSFLKEVQAIHPGAIEFRLAETAVFVPKDFTNKMLEACEAIVDTIADPKFKELTKNAIPKDLVVPDENDHAHFLAANRDLLLGCAVGRISRGRTPPASHAADYFGAHPGV